MTNITLKAQERKKGFKRTATEIPAVVYGPKTKNQKIIINYSDFDKLYKTSGESTLIDLEINKQKPFKALIHQIQYNPLTDKYLHVDFYQLDMTKKLKVEIDINFQGIEEVEKASAGEAIKNLDKIEVECRPEDLIKEIKLDVRKYLKQIGDVIYAKDLDLSDKLTLITPGDVPVISLKEIKEEIIETTSEEETETAEEKAENESDEKQEKAEDNKKESENKDEENNK